MDMDPNNVSAFAAYTSQSPPAKDTAAAAKKKRAAAQKVAAAAAAQRAADSAKDAADSSFAQLSHDEMIARLITKKKQELKRKSEGEKTGATATKKAAKRNKKTGAPAAVSAPVSRDTTASSPDEEEAVVIDDDDAPAPTGPKKVSRSAHHQLVHPIKIHPKHPEDLSIFLSKRNTKRNANTNNKNGNSSANAMASATNNKNGGNNLANAKASATNSREADSPSSANGNAVEPALHNATLVPFFDLAQSTPIVSNGNPAGGKSGKKTASKSKSMIAAIKEEPAQTPAASVTVHRPIVDVAGEQPTNVSSIEAGKDLLSWIIHPTTVEEFMANAWEQTPLLVDRKHSTYYSQLLSTAIFDRMLREQRVEFTKNLDVTSYVDGVRETHNPDGRATPPTVWDFYRQGCSIRLLNPQTFLPVVHSMNATLQEYFQCMTGANVYLTPANSQGFAPHYDDIEAFVMQIEGKKHWKVYKPRTVDEQLPRDSSPNFTQAEIGQPILDVILEAGDLLYFPRGFIHQATTVPGHHSMHITLSAYQKNSYADLLEQLLPAMLQSSIAQGVLLRRGLPLNTWQCMGLVHSDEDDTNAAQTHARRTILAQVRACLDLTMKSFEQNVDDAVDRLAVRFQHDALPPHLTAGERARTVLGGSGTQVIDGAVEQAMPTLRTPVRLVRANILRLVRHSATEFRIYYHSDNSREYHELEQTYVEIGADDAPAVEYLVKAYPEYTTPGELPIEDDEQAVVVVQDLWERGLLLTQDVLQ